MSWIVPTALFLEILLLLYVATIDITTRLIRNEICHARVTRDRSQLASPMQVVSLIAATILLLLLLVIYRGTDWRRRRQVAGCLGDWSPLAGVIQLLTVTALAGGVLALVLMMRQLPVPPGAGRIVARTPRLRDRALAPFATRAASLRVA